MYYSQNIEEDTNSNSNFRKVVHTGKYSQLVLMSLKPLEDIGQEVHNDVDQFFRFESGEGKVVIDGTELVVKDGNAVVVPAGSVHNVINTSGEKDLKFYTIYSPFNHPEFTVHATKEEAMEAEKDEVTQ
jgi:mannose-6-phosphate isomerase-like protein (cupin superfamily)